jgi:hypothetical protein
MEKERYCMGRTTAPDRVRPRPGRWGDRPDLPAGASGTVHGPRLGQVYVDFAEHGEYEWEGDGGTARRRNDGAVEAMRRDCVPEAEAVAAERRSAGIRRAVAGGEAMRVAQRARRRRAGR